MRVSGILFAVVLLFAVIFSFLAVHTTKIGTYSDDIQYLLAAQSISDGHYYNQYAPGESPIMYYHPGYPFILSIISKITGFREDAFRFLNFLLIWGSLGILYLCTKDRLALVLSGLSPLVVWHLGDVMPDALFMFLSFAIILLAIAGANRSFKPLFYASVFLAVFSFYVRPTGLVNIIFLALFLAVNGRLKAAGYALSLFMAFTAPLFVYNRITGNSGFHYVNLVSGLAGMLTSFSNNVLFYFTLLFSKGIAYIPPALNNFVSWIIVAVLCLSVVIGINKLKNNFAARTIILWAACYAFFHLFWVYSDVRYLFALVPVAVYFSVNGFYYVLKTKPALFFAAVIAITASFITADLQLIKNSFHNLKTGLRAQEEKYEWIKSNIKGKVFLSFYAPRMYYYTKNQSFSMAPVKDPDMFYYKLLEKKIDYIFLTDITGSLRSDTSLKSHVTIQNHIKEFVSNKTIHASSRYELVFRDSSNGTEIYRVAAPHRHSETGSKNNTKCGLSYRNLHDLKNY